MAQKDLTWTYPARVGADGRAVVTIIPGNMQQWRVRQVSISMPDAAAGATAMLILNGSPLTALVPNIDAADGVSVVLRGSAAQLTVLWTGCPPGATGTVIALYDEEEWQ